MITYFQAIVLGLFQGLTELFPVSSLGHSVIMPAVFGWKLAESDSFFIVFLVATHFATSLALLVLFYKDWLRIVRGFFVSLPVLAKNIAGKKGVVQIASADLRMNAKLAWLLIAGTIPAGLLGLIFQNRLQALFSSPRIVAIVLILNGCMLLFIERSYATKSLSAKMDTMNTSTEGGNGGGDSQADIRISKLTFRQALKIGLCQALALIPGISRTGSTLGGGVSVDLNRDDAARFAFFLATPIIFAAALLKLPALIQYIHTGGIHIAGPFAAGFIAAFIAAYISARYLLTYFKTKTLAPFAWYCIVVGLIASIILSLH